MKMKKNQSKSLIFVGIIIVVLVIAGFIIFSGHKNTNVNSTQTKNKPSTIQASKVLFSTSQYEPYAYLISTKVLSSQTKTALAGFNLTSKQNANGTTTYILTTSKPSYTNQSYTISSGEKLYFVEHSLGDDNSATDTDYFLGDDKAIVVDANGYIKQ